VVNSRGRPPAHMASTESCRLLHSMSDVPSSETVLYNCMQSNDVQPVSSSLPLIMHCGKMLFMVPIGKITFIHQLTLKGTSANLNCINSWCQEQSTTASATP